MDAFDSFLWRIALPLVFIGLMVAVVYIGYQYDSLQQRHARFLVHYQKLRDRLRQLEDDDPYLPLED